VEKWIKLAEDLERTLAMIEKVDVEGRHARRGGIENDMPVEGAE
jgi:hypothetical protein